MSPNRLLAVALVLLACGRKGPPLPPLREVPETTTDLQVFQEENQVVLRWSYPALTRSGRPLGELGSVEVWKAEVPPGQEKALEGEQGVVLKRQLLIGRGKLLARLSGQDLAAATRGGQLEYRENLSSAVGLPLALYAVRSRKPKGAPSEFSNVVSWQARTPPPAPAEPHLEPQAQGIGVRWPTAPGTAYRLERREGEGPWQVLGETSEGSWLDRSAQQGKSYAFRLRAVVAGVVGFPSQPAAVNYRDRYPPPPPANLLCLPEEGRVVLRWESPAEESLSYRIFRRRGEGPWVHLHERLTERSYLDSSPPPGQLTYAVKAVDQAGNESEAALCSARGGL